MVCYLEWEWHYIFYGNLLDKEENRKIRLSREKAFNKRLPSYTVQSTKSNVIDDAIHKMKIKEHYDDKLKTLYLLREKIQELILYYEDAKKGLK